MGASLISHDKLLRQGKISRREYNDLVYYKSNDPMLYKYAEKGYSRRPKNFRRDNPDPYGQHIQRAEASQ